jgi:Protein of unknown function (DUF2917)
MIPMHAQTHWSLTMRQTLTLPTDRFARLDGAACLRVTQGTLWLTIDGKPDDLVLAAGDRLALPAHAHALVQALDAPARLTVERDDDVWKLLAIAVWRPLTAAWQVATRRAALSS